MNKFIAGVFYTVCFITGCTIGVILAAYPDLQAEARNKPQQEYSYEDYEIYVHELSDGKATIRVIEFPSYNEPWKLCYYSYSSTGGPVMTGC